MTEALADLDRTLPQNQHVQILPKAGGWIALVQAGAPARAGEPPGPQGGPGGAWPMTSLLDMLKETDLRVGFTEAFQSPTAFESTGPGDPATAPAALPVRPGHQHRPQADQRRATTTSPTRTCSTSGAGSSPEDHPAARHRRGGQRHLPRARLPQIWGEGTTACASDSKKFGAWDQNLMTEWHVRYGGRG